MSLHDVFLPSQSRYATRPLSFSCSLTMFSDPASSYCRLPLFASGKDRQRALTECRDWLPRPRSPDLFEPLPPGQSQENIRAREICEVLSTNDLYHILGVARSPAIDRLTLRRAYLSRSKACHPEFVSFPPSLSFSLSTRAQQVSRKPGRDPCVPKSLYSVRRALPALSKTNVRRSPKRRATRFLAFTSLRVRRRNFQGRSLQHRQRLFGRQPRDDTHAAS